MEKIRIEKTSAPKPKCDVSKIGFGTVFSDHMFVMDYEKKKGWYDPRIVPFGPFMNLRLRQCSTMRLRYLKG